MKHAVLRRGATARVIGIRSKHETLRPEHRRDLRELVRDAISERKPKRFRAHNVKERAVNRCRAFDADNPYSTAYGYDSEPWYVR